MRLIHLALLCLCLAANAAFAAPREVRLFAPKALVETGLFAYVLPRFKLKTQIRVVLVDTQQKAEVVIDLYPAGQTLALLRMGDQVFAAWPVGGAVREAAQKSPAARLLDWLYSDIGQRTLTAYRSDGQQLVFAVERVEKAPEITLPEGDLALGRALAYRNCGRCHVVGEDNRMQGIESTPSFPLLRSLPDWQARFTTYYTRIPHPAFTQIEGLTKPFDAMLPPPIVPLELDVDQFNAILAFVAHIKPADLGAPLEMR